MALYCIGDLQGCNAPFQRLLEKIDFSASRDTVYLLGDLVNRGPDSLGTLRYLANLGDAAQCILGNHDLHTLAVWQGLRPPGRSDTIQELLRAPDSAALLDWLRHRPMALHEHGWLMVHAGVLPQWDVATTMALGAEVQSALRGHDLKGLMQNLFGNAPGQWQDGLTGADRLRVVVNALTRLRFCTLEGDMDFGHSGGVNDPPAGYLPWFDVPGRKTASTPIAFGHWSTLITPASRSAGMRHNTLPLDTGCIWGGRLTAARLGALPGEFELITVKCDQVVKPGKQALTRS